MPALLCSSSVPVGCLQGVNHSGSVEPEDSARVISWSCESTLGWGIALCDLRLGGSARCNFFFRDTVEAASTFPYRLAEFRALLRSPGLRRFFQRWRFPLPTRVFRCHADAEPPRCAQGLPSALLSASFFTAEAAVQWAKSAAVIRAWLSGPLSVRTWGPEQAKARQEMLAVAFQACAGRMQAVLSHAAPMTQPIDVPGCYVYALASPFWGRCYPGGCGYRGPRPPLARWIEHLRLAKTWGSATSQRRYGHCCPPLYSAMAAVGPENAVLVILSVVPRETLADRETHFTRILQPVFNVRPPTEDQGWNLRALASSSVDDVLTLGARLLRRAHPRLKQNEWAALISAAALAGDRTLAAKLARQARGLSRSLGRLRAFPLIVVPCPLPTALLQAVNHTLHRKLRLVPGFLRTPQHHIILATGRVCWYKSSYADAVLAPAWPDLERLSPCRCSDEAHHICTRQWSSVAACMHVRELVGDRCLSY